MTVGASASTFMAATGARLVGPPVPAEVAAAEAGRRPDAGGRAGGRGHSATRSPSASSRTSTPGRSACWASPSTGNRWRPPAGAPSSRLCLGALSALLLAIVLSNVLARRMTRPLQNLHAGALSIARGDLDTSFAVDTDDEIGDVAEAFRIMTRSLRENQEGLAARVRELVTVHQVGRAVSSVVDLGQVLRAVITEILQRARRQDRRDRARRRGRAWASSRRSSCAPSRAIRWASAWRRSRAPWPPWAVRAARPRSRPIPS